MNTKKTILHIIQNFGRGGAETTVVGVLKNLTEYNNIVVALDGLNEFADELKADKYYSLDLRSYYLFPLAIRKLRKIIRDHKVDIVHSQLYWSTILARFACPKNVPLITSIQASLTNSVEYKKKWICWLDQFSYNYMDSIIIGVSKHTLDDYFDFLKLQRHRHYVLYNYVDTRIFKPVSHIRTAGSQLKMISVGNLKAQKNQLYLLKAMIHLKNEPVSLDIYGDGQLKPMLEAFIREHNLPVRLMGKVTNLDKVMHEYDLFVMPSLYEGFSLAVLEGMVKEMPMLLSDTPTFREQAADAAFYFSLDDESDFANRILELKTDPQQLALLGAKGKMRVLEHFTMEHHLSRLRDIYRMALDKR